MSETTSPAQLNTLKVFTRNAAIGVGATALALLAPDQASEQSIVAQPIQIATESYEPSGLFDPEEIVFNKNEMMHHPVISPIKKSAPIKVEKHVAQAKAECWDGKLSDLSHTHAQSLGNIALACQLAVDESWYKQSPKKQMTCLVYLWDRESGWNQNSHNKSSGAHGIPQALPGSKMQSVGSNWRTSAVTQIKWGLGYIDGRYGSPCDALSSWNNKGWY